MVGEATMEFENPVDRYFIKLGIIVMIFCITLSVIVTLVTGKILGMLMPGILGVLVLVRTWQVEVLHRPETVTVSNQGITMRFRNSKTEEFAWSSIRDVYSKPGPAWTKSGRGIGRGGVRMVGKRAVYPITYEASATIVRAYTTAIGRPPEAWDGASH